MRRLGFANEIKAIRRQRETGDDIQDVMLIRQDGREPDHDEPGDDGDAHDNTAAPRVDTP